MLTRIKVWLKHCPIYLIKWVSFLEKLSAFALTVVILFFMFFIGAEVLSRYFIRPIPGHLEIVELVVPVLAAIGIGYAQKCKSHVRVELFIHMLKGRMYHFVESLLLVLAFCIFLILAICTFRDALSAYQIGDVTLSYEFPTWGGRFFVSIGFALICFRLLIQLTQNLIQIAKGIERKDLN